MEENGTNKNITLEPQVKRRCAAYSKKEIDQKKKVEATEPVLRSTGSVAPTTQRTPCEGHSLAAQVDRSRKHTAPKRSSESERDPHRRRTTVGEAAGHDRPVMGLHLQHAVQVRLDPGP